MESLRERLHDLDVDGRKIAATQHVVADTDISK
jgi:hypothetical protein